MSNVHTCWFSPSAGFLSSWDVTLTVTWQVPLLDTPSIASDDSSLIEDNGALEGDEAGETSPCFFSVPTVSFLIASSVWGDLDAKKLVNVTMNSLKSTFPSPFLSEKVQL